MKFVSGGGSYHVEIEGSGFPLILLHGFTGDRSTWDPFISRWKSGSMAISIDIAGHGDTDVPASEESYTVTAAARMIHELMESLQFPRADLLGYSMGGRLALSFAALYPGNVRKLILESASPGLETAEERMNRRNQDERLGEYIKENGIKAFVDYWENIPLFKTQKMLPADVQKQIREQRLQNSPEGLGLSLRGMGTGAQPSWWGKLTDIKADTLLITGSEDVKFCTLAERMSKLIPVCQWETVFGAGHAIHVEEPEKFGTIVSEFLQKL